MHGRDSLPSFETPCCARLLRMRFHFFARFFAGDDTGFGAVIPDPTRPLLLALDVERADHLAPAGDFCGHVTSESCRIRVERLGGIVLRELPHLRLLEERARFAVDAIRDVGRELL